jgi:hypothetical protein
MTFVFPIDGKLEGSDRSAEKEVKAPDNPRIFGASLT